MKIFKSIIAFACLACMVFFSSCELFLEIPMQNSSNTQSTLSDMTSSEDISLNTQPSTYPDALSPEEYYGWSLLKQNGSDAEKKAYKLLASEIGKYKNEITFDFKLTKSEFERVYGLYKEDYPEHFYRGNEYSLSSRGSRVKKVTFNGTLYGGNAEKIRAAKSKIDASVGHILSKINTSMTDFEKELVVHNHLIENTSYAEGENSHSMLGVFADGKAVCQGYSLAFQYVMRLAGVQCITVTGKFNDQSHMWNMIKLDGDFYHIDVTADDPTVDTGEDVIDFNYFNLNDEQIKIDHTINNKEYTLPKALLNKYEFFTKTGQFYTDFGVDSFANSIVYAYKNGYSYAYARFEKADISKASEYIKQNYKKIINKANELLDGQKIKSDNKISIMYSSEKKILNLRINY